MKKITGRRFCRRAAVCLSVLLISIIFLGNHWSFAASEKKTEQTDQRVVKVGYLETPGICEKDKYGNYTGLTPDYLNEIAKYTNWEYEYVPTTADTFIQDLADGKYDVLGGAFYAKELEPYFAYPKYSMGSSRAGLLCLKEDNRIKSYELNTLNGKTIGVYEKADEKIRRLKDFLKINNIKCRLKYYGPKDLSESGDLYKYLLNKEVDLLLGNELEENPDFRLAASFDAQPYYLVTSPKNKEILNGINSALEKIQDADPGFEKEKYEENFKDRQKISSVYLTKEEEKYIAAKKSVSVAVVADWHPFYCKQNTTDHHDGIIPEMLEEISDFSGLKFTYVTADSYEEAIRLVQEGKADIMGFFLDTEADARKNDLVLTSAYVSLNNIVIRNKSENFPSDGMEAGVLKGRTLPDEIKAKRVKYYKDAEEIISALNKGKVDFVYGLAASMEQEMQNHRYNNVVPVTGVNINMGVSFALAGPADTNLLSILNKSINNVTSDERNTILNRNLVSFGTSFSFKDYIYANPIAVLCLLAVIMLMAAAAFILTYRSKMRSRIMQSELEKAEAKSRAKSEFLSQMSHEIRTPMNAITGLTDLLRMEEKLPDGAREKLQKIHASSQYMLSLINDILDMSKIENGKLNIEPEDFSLTELLDGLIEMMEVQAEEKQIQFEFVREIEHDFVTGDPIRLRQVLTNLLSNAFKFTKHGGRVTLTVREEHRDVNTGKYFFSVKDNGIGIAQDRQKQIFEAFEQLGASSARSEGTGLGLPISSSIIKAMGGNLMVESQTGKGSEFYFRLCLPTGKDSTNYRSENALELRQFHDIRILVAEDNDLNAEIVKELLEMEGASAERAVNGQEAVERFLSGEQGRYQLILMDIKMPLKNGYEAAEEIRKSSHPDAETVPIIAMTANSFKEDMDAAFASGMNGFVPKPIDIGYLNQVMEENLKKE